MRQKDDESGQAAIIIPCFSLNDHPHHVLYRKKFRTRIDNMYSDKNGLHSSEMNEANVAMTLSASCMYGSKSNVFVS